MTGRGPVRVAIQRRDGQVVVRWTSGDVEGSCRFDHLPGTAPEWLASAEDLLAGADRRTEARVLDAVAAAAREAGLELGIWHDDEGVELLA